ncbi:Gas vesicle structural protein [Streptomyces violaceorubidus]
MVIDVRVRVSLVGIEILKVDARIVVASVDTYLRFAEACNRLDLEHDVRSKTVPEMFGSPVAKTVGRAGARRTAHPDSKRPSSRRSTSPSPRKRRTPKPVPANTRSAAGALSGPGAGPPHAPATRTTAPCSRPRRRTEEEDR